MKVVLKPDDKVEKFVPPEKMQEEIEKVPKTPKKKKLKIEGKKDGFRI